MPQRGVPRSPKWTDDEISYLREHYGKAPGEEIARALGRTYNAVTERARRHGLRSRRAPRRWSEAEDAYITENYGKIPNVELASALGRSYFSLKAREDRLGVREADIKAAAEIRASVRHDYFADVDSPIKAYILGLLASDGWISENQVCIALGVKDRALVELVRDELAPLYPVSTQAGGSRALFAASSSRMKSDLGRLGVVPRKTLALQWPAALPERFAGSYILGCFDGDGSLGYYADYRYYRWSLISASRPFLEDVKERIKVHAGVKLRGPYGRSSGSLALVIEYTGPKTRLIDEWLHADVPGLARKRIPA
jgi:hypothetical protein